MNDYYDVYFKAREVIKKILEIADANFLFPFVWGIIESYVVKNPDKVSQIFEEIKKILK